MCGDLDGMLSDLGDIRQRPTLEAVITAAAYCCQGIIAGSRTTTQRQTMTDEFGQGVEGVIQADALHLIPT
jgi:hypothetical protein